MFLYLRSCGILHILWLASLQLPPAFGPLCSLRYVSRLGMFNGSPLVYAAYEQISDFTVISEAITLARPVHKQILDLLCLIFVVRLDKVRQMHKINSTHSKLTGKKCNVMCGHSKFSCVKWKYVHLWRFGISTELCYINTFQHLISVLVYSALWLYASESFF